VIWVTPSRTSPRLGIHLPIQTTLEAEVIQFLGRDRYARGERAREGSRNGYYSTTIKATARPITLDRQRLPGPTSSSPTTCTVGRICEAIKVEFESWRTRDLSELRLDYLALDRSHFKLHPRARDHDRDRAGGSGDHHERTPPILVALASASWVSRRPSRLGRLGARSRGRGGTPGLIDSRVTRVAWSRK